MVALNHFHLDEIIREILRVFPDHHGIHKLLNDGQIETTPNPNPRLYRLSVIIRRYYADTTPGTIRRTMLYATVAMLFIQKLDTMYAYVHPKVCYKV